MKYVNKIRGSIKLTLNNITNNLRNKKAPWRLTWTIGYVSITFHFEVFKMDSITALKWKKTTRLQNSIELLLLLFKI